jgi:hypothetical protein
MRICGANILTYILPCSTGYHDAVYQTHSGAFRKLGTHAGLGVLATLEGWQMSCGILFDSRNHPFPDPHSAVHDILTFMQEVSDIECVQLPAPNFPNLCGELAGPEGAGAELVRAFVNGIPDPDIIVPVIGV